MPRGRHRQGLITKVFQIGHSVLPAHWREWCPGSGTRKQNHAVKIVIKPQPHVDSVQGECFQAWQHKVEPACASTSTFGSVGMSISPVVSPSKLTTVRTTDASVTKDTSPSSNSMLSSVRSYRPKEPHKTELQILTICRRLSELRKTGHS